MTSFPSKITKEPAEEPQNMQEPGKSTTPLTVHHSDNLRGPPGTFTSTGWGSLNNLSLPLEKLHCITLTELREPTATPAQSSFASIMVQIMGFVTKKQSFSQFII